MRDSQRENQLPKELDRVMGLLSKVYAQDGERALQEVLVNAKVRIVEETDYDNWNGGQWGHDVHLSLPADLIVPLLKSKADIESKLRSDLNNGCSTADEYVANVYLEIEHDEGADWRKDSGLLRTSMKSVGEAAERRIWVPGQFRLFLSHKTEVKKQTAALKEALSRFGVSCFVAHEDIHPTQDWQNEIEAALASADAFAALLTEEFHNSLWTDQEVGYALARGIPILAIKLGRDPYGFIGRFQAISSTWKSAPLGIMKILMKQDRMIGAYIEAVRKCRSFDEANQLSELLPYIERISAESGKALINAYNENSEVRGGFGFNGAKPQLYGKGLIFHLERLGSKNLLIERGQIVSA